MSKQNKTGQASRDGAGGPPVGTSDKPRSEDPEAILSAVVEGLDANGKVHELEIELESDRRSLGSRDEDARPSEPSRDSPGMEIGAIVQVLAATIVFCFAVFLSVYLDRPVLGSIALIAALLLALLAVPIRVTIRRRLR